MKQKKIKTNGRMVEITTALCALAIRKKCNKDSREEIIVKAVNYITELEKKIIELESYVKAYKKMEQKIYNKINTLEKEEKNAGISNNKRD